MELKEYQLRALDAVSRWNDALTASRREWEEMTAVVRRAGSSMPAYTPDHPETAWKALKEAGVLPATAGRHVGRTDDAGRSIPHFCLKVPTGGGKTLLAAATLERLHLRTGLVLWVTPTRAIYAQTRRALRTRAHWIRQVLERSSGGRVKVLEKEDAFSAADIAHSLCVMLLMLPATNRRKGRDFLRMFRDSGRYPTLFPDSDDGPGNAKLLGECPDLERTEGDESVPRNSLYNAFKLLRPVVVLDEAHKAYGAPDQRTNEEFARSVSRLNPRLVVELSATPNRGISNLLVDISGVDLKAEQMIKLPIEVVAFPQADWRFTLERATDEAERLALEAKTLRGEAGRYIRPIVVVRVERTGAQQRDGERVHAEDVREHLVRELGVPPDAVAVKSAEQDELRDTDLLSAYCPVRWIITRAALMEGWDCPFAYILVMLDNTNAQRAITQLVGRVMRQPHAQQTGREALDRCYVYCRATSVGTAVQQVKNGLEREGLTGLGGEVRGGSASPGLQPVTVRRRSRFRGQDIFLPLVLHRAETKWEELDYHRHILARIDWDSIGPPEFEASLATAFRRESASVDLAEDTAIAGGQSSERVAVNRSVSVLWFVRRIPEVFVPNAWQAARMVGAMLASLRASGLTDPDVFDRRSFLAWRLREHVEKEVTERGERLFREKLCKGEIRFDLKAGRMNFRMPEEFRLAMSGRGSLASRRDHEPMARSLFEPVFEEQFDSALEFEFARYLDEEKALRWWHRIAARQRGDYYLRGWRLERVWPDFVAMAGKTPGVPHILLFETKGGHLRGPDTEYKEKVLRLLERTFNKREVDCGQVTIQDGSARGTFRLVFSEEEFPAALQSVGAEEE